MKSNSLYHLVILNQKPKDGLYLIVPTDYAKIFTSSRIYLKKLTFTGLATAFTVFKHVPNI